MVTSAPNNIKNRTAVEAFGVSKQYATSRRRTQKVVCDVDLSVAAGSWIVIRGPSGSGKSTLIRLLTGLERPSAGHVFFEGEDISQMSSDDSAWIRRRMGIVMQEPYLLPGLTPVENLAWALVPRGLMTGGYEKLIQTWFDRLQLSLDGFIQARRLSGGEQQRVAIARALITQPNCVFADEPTSALDPELSRCVRDVLLELKSHGTTLVVATHDPILIEAADEVHDLQQGVLV